MLKKSIFSQCDCLFKYNVIPSEDAVGWVLTCSWLPRLRISRIQAGVWGGAGWEMSGTATSAYC